MSKELNDMLIKNFNSLVETEKTDYFYNLSFILKSTLQNSDKTTHLQFPDFDLSYVLNCLKTINIDSQDFYARQGLLYFLNFLFGLAKKSDLVKPGSIGKITNLISSILSSFPVPSTSILSSSKNRLEIDVTLSTINLSMELGEKTYRDELNSVFETIQKDPSSVHDTMVKLAYISKVSELNELAKTDLPSAKEKITNMVDSLIEEKDDRLRRLRFYGLGKVCPELTMEFASGCLKPSAKTQDIIFYNLFITDPLSSEVYIDFMIENSSFFINSIPHGMRLRVIKECDNCSSEAALQKLSTLKEKYPEFVKDPRIYGEAEDSINSNLKLAKIFAEEISNLSCE